MGALLNPTMTLADILRPATIVSQRPHEDSVDWLPSHPVWIERTSGSPLPLVGTRPVVCHEAVATDAALRLLEVAGHEIPSEILTYRSPAEFRDHIRSGARKGRELFVTYPPRNPLCPESAYWIPLPLLRYLNDKANIAELLPGDRVPERRILLQAELASFLDRAVQHLPFVLKASTKLGTGGGAGLVICRNAADVERARGRLASAERVVVETFYEFTSSWCVNVAVSREGVRYLGVAQQICSEEGVYLGNWCESGPHDEALASIGEHAGRAGRQLGYFGILGVDVGRTVDGRWLAHDLNFRLNGSTPQTLLHTALERTWGITVSRFAPCLTYDGPYASMIQQLTERTKRGHLLPLATFDGRLVEAGSEESSCGVLLLGDSRQQVVSRLGQLHTAGFTF